MKTPLVTRDPEGLPLGAVRRGSVSPEGGSVSANGRAGLPASA
ncbi:hypothetical protein ACFHWW_02645 [Ensifer sp. P24N7]